ncbi:MAG: hypothetical protein NQ127_00580 [Candidatus Cardinium sp.]|nr:hypothetical protein [Candidatus Cardinium sp.]
MAIRYFIGFFLLLFCLPGEVIGCFKAKKKIYSEDISYHRMPFYTAKKGKKEAAGSLVLSHDQTSRLEGCLAKRRLACERMPYLKGFTIQVYMGNSRATALSMQERAAALQTMYTPRLHYRQPNYVVQLGFFPERLEAYFVYVSLAKALPHVLLRPFMLKKEGYPLSLQNN